MSGLAYGLPLWFFCTCDQAVQQNHHGNAWNWIKLGGTGQKMCENWRERAQLWRGAILLGMAWDDGMDLAVPLRWACGMVEGVGGEG
ncbi:MAG: hypothetical protein H7839_09180 [Magnetococcus sp. YQC-5]